MDSKIEPLFCIETALINPNKRLFINIKASSIIHQPNLEHLSNVEELVHEMASTNNTPKTKKFNINFKSSPIFWSTEDRFSQDKHYVVDVLINDKFGENVKRERVIQHYLIHVIMSVLEDKYNVGDQMKNAQHNLGHHINWVVGEYKVLEDIKCFYRSEEIVNSTVKYLHGTQGECIQDVNEVPYILHYRPGSNYLTFSLTTDRLPSSFSFNDDRLIVETCSHLGIIEIHLPFFINVNEPVKYKYDDNSCSFRIVFRTVESPQ